MAESSSLNRHAGEKRRSTRVMQAVPITVKGTDALGQNFKEATSTVMVNCFGCKFQSRHYVPKNSIITLEIRHTKRPLSPRIVRGRVIWVQRPRTFREVFHIGMEFDIPGNVWSIEVPPKDWFPHPEDEELLIPVYPEAGEPEPVAAPATVRHNDKSEAVTEMRAASRAAADQAGDSPAPSSAVKTLSMPGAAPHPGADPAISGELLKAAVRDAVAEEMARMRPHLDAQLQQAIETSLDSLVERITEAAANNVVAQVAERTASAVEDARQACQSAVDELDGKISKSVEDALAEQQANPYKTPARRKRHLRY